MFAKVEISVWLLTLIIVFAAVTFASHFLFPSVRWFFRKLAERAIARLNKRLARPIEPFKLARRYDTIERLIYDPDVAQAIAAYSASERVPESVAFEKARHYAREIVPSFSATAYFGFGTRLAAWLSRTMYQHPAGRVRPRGAVDHRPGRGGGVRDEPPQQHGLCPGHVPDLGRLGAVLCGGRMGAGLAAFGD